MEMKLILVLFISSFMRSMLENPPPKTTGMETSCETLSANSTSMSSFDVPFLKYWGERNLVICRLSAPFSASILHISRESSISLYKFTRQWTCSPRIFLINFIIETIFVFHYVGSTAAYVPCSLEENVRDAGKAVHATRYVVLPRAA